MPRAVDNAKIALVNSAIEVKKTEAGCEDPDHGPQRAVAIPGRGGIVHQGTS